MAKDCDHGIQVYEILENGNLLNAVYTNTGLLNKVSKIPNDYCIDIEIARKKIYNKKGIVGEYECKYLETYAQPDQVSAKFCYLNISSNKGVYTFKWTDANGKLIFEGLGLMAGTTHIAVSYIPV